VYAQYTVAVKPEKRSIIQDILKAKGIPRGIYYRNVSMSNWYFKTLDILKVISLFLS
jgi:hypothetical protein